MPDLVQLDLRTFLFSVPDYSIFTQWLHVSTKQGFNLKHGYGFNLNAIHVSIFWVQIPHGNKTCQKCFLPSHACEKVVCGLGSVTGSYSVLKHLFPPATCTCTEKGLNSCNCAKHDSKPNQLFFLLCHIKLHFKQEKYCW